VPQRIVIKKGEVYNKNIFIKIWRQV
jgi:hypothetical protein